jgi:hypothetical protein
VTLHHTLGVGSRIPVLSGNIVSCDEFAVNLGKVKKKPTKVKTTPQAKEEMAKQMKSLKNKDNKTFQAKKSMAKITISLAINPTGQIVCAVFAVRQQDFDLKKPKKGAEATAWRYKCSSMQVQCTTH